MDLGKVRVIFIGGTSFFTRVPLRAVAARCQLVGIVDSTPAPSLQPQNNGLAGPGLIRRFARHRGLPCFVASPGGPRPAEFIQRLRPDVICVASSNLLLRRGEFDVPRWGAINLHPSLLPRYRGPNPFFWQYHGMDLAGGVTVHRIDEGIDTGDILLQERFEIALGAPFLHTFQTALRVGTAALIQTLEHLATGRAAPQPQPLAPDPLYARFVQSHERFVDWDAWPLERVWHFLRGTHHEHPCLASEDGYQWLIGELDATPAGAPPGSIGRDSAGHYLAHTQGKIRLARRRTDGLPQRLLPPARRLRRILEWW